MEKLNCINSSLPLLIIKTDVKYLQSIPMIVDHDPSGCITD